MVPESEAAPKLIYKWVVIVMVAFCVVLSLYVNVYQREDLVYTHFFYVPIILAGLWFQYSSVYLAIALGIFHIFLNYLTFDTITPSSTYRAGFFILIALLVSYSIRAVVHKSASASKAPPSPDPRLTQIDMAGKIAVEIGHEIRNPLTTVRGFLQILKQDQTEGEESEYFALMIEELDKANEVISHLINLSGSKISHPKLHDLNTLLENLLESMIPAAGSQQVEIHTHLGKLTPLMVDEEEINLLLLNLVVNAIDSMPDGGHLTITTRMNGNQVLLEVRDQGHGIPQDIAEHIGTPFFTTKASSRGLGLATCWSIVKRNQAHLSYQSTPNGTTFTVEFSPAHDTDSETAFIQPS